VWDQGTEKVDSKSRDRAPTDGEGLHDLGGSRSHRDVETFLNDLEDTVRDERRAYEASALRDAYAEEAATLELLAHVDRDLRNITRVSRRLVDERNALAARAGRLHKAIRHMEPALGEEAHRDHGVDLSAKGLVQHVASETWRMDNRDDWGFEEGTPEEDDCAIGQISRAHVWTKQRLRVIDEVDGEEGTRVS
jgi:hypothetical protein